VDIQEAYLLMKRSMAAGRLGHAYLVIGPPATEGRALAEKLAALLLCTSDEEERPCGTCRGCRAVEAGTHADVHWVEPELKSRQVSVEQMRSLQSRFQETSFAGGWRVGVVLAADRMGRAAANAFLKTLEEPPQKSLLLFLTDAPHALLPTVTSRCRTLRLSEETQALPQKWLEEAAAILGSGSPSRLEAMARADALADLFGTLKSTAESEVKETLEGDPVWESHEADERKKILTARTGARYREYRDGLLLFVAEWYRDMLCAGGVGPELLRHARHEAVLKTRAAATPRAAVLKALRTIEEIRQRFDRNLPEPMVLAAAAADLP
jgi:DNA polymerase-3 subunit delta'